MLDSGRYDPAQVDFSDVIKTVMQFKATKVEKGEKPEPPTHRSDAAFIFVAASTAGTARLILPQLKYNYSGDVPVYSTSDSFEPDPNANSDIDGMLFPDMPWMISNDPATAQIRDSVRAAWPARTARRDRLYAFGFDAYRLVPGLRSSNPAASSEIAGVTGKLHLDQQNKIRRDLDWAQIRSGSALCFIKFEASYSALARRFAPPCPARHRPPPRQCQSPRPRSPIRVRRPISSFINARIWTVNPKQPEAEALAVLNGRFVAVGTEAEVMRWQGPRTRIVDAQGNRLLPGFNDAHVHFSDGGASLSSVQLTNVTSLKEFVQRIADYAAHAPKGEWIRNGEWDETKWSPASCRRARISMRSRPTIRSRSIATTATCCSPIPRRWRWPASPPRRRILPAA